jgi:predicted phosphodiesterase
VGYGCFPEETIALLRERAIPCVAGNHDRWALGRGSAENPLGGPDTSPRDASGWDLSSTARRFLRALPRSWHGLVEDLRVAVHHGSPKSDMDVIDLGQVTGRQLRRHLDAADADVLVVGHSHDPFRLVAPGGGVVVNPGALRRKPPDEELERKVMVFDTRKDAFVEVSTPPTGTFGVIELPSRKFTVHLASDGSEVEIARAAKY